MSGPEVKPEVSGSVPKQSPLKRIFAVIGHSFGHAYRWWIDLGSGNETMKKVDGALSEIVRNTFKPGVYMPPEDPFEKQEPKSKFSGWENL